MISHTYIELGLREVGTQPSQPGVLPARSNYSMRKKEVKRIEEKSTRGRTRPITSHIPHYTMRANRPMAREPAAGTASDADPAVELVAAGAVSVAEARAEVAAAESWRVSDTGLSAHPR